VIDTDLQATWIEATLTRQRTVNMNDLVTEIVKYVHFKRTEVVAPIPLATTTILSSEKDLLTN
jgi:hypothetical protein